MTLHHWFITLHLVAIVAYGGALLTLLVLWLVAREQQGDGRRALLGALRATRTRIMQPALGVLLGAGLAMLFGLDRGVAELSFAVDNYLYSRTPDGAHSYWFITFHVKLVLAVFIVVLDVLIGRSLKRAQTASDVEPIRGRDIVILVLVSSLFVLLCIVLMKAGVLTGPMMAG